MDIQKAIDEAIKSAINSLSVSVGFDGDGDLAVTLLYEGEEVYSDCVDLDDKPE